MSAFAMAHPWLTFWALWWIAACAAQALANLGPFVVVKHIKEPTT